MDIEHVLYRYLKYIYLTDFKEDLLSYMVFLVYYIYMWLPLQLKDLFRSLFVLQKLNATFYSSVCSSWFIRITWVVEIWSIDIRDSRVLYKKRKKNTVMYYSTAALS